MKKFPIATAILAALLLFACGSDDNSDPGAQTKVFPKDYPAAQDANCPRSLVAPTDWQVFACTAWAATHDAQGNEVPRDRGQFSPINRAECTEINNNALAHGLVTQQAHDWNEYWGWCTLVSSKGDKVVAIGTRTE